MLQPPVDDVSFVSARVNRPQACLDFGNHAAGNYSALDELARLVSRERGDETFLVRKKFLLNLCADTRIREQLQDD